MRRSGDDMMFSGDPGEVRSGEIDSQLANSAMQYHVIDHVAQKRGPAHGSFQFLGVCCGR